MAARSAVPHLEDIIEAIERVREALGDLSLEQFESDWRRQWLVERGVEIVSEASRRIPDELKSRHPEIPWQKVAGIGNVLRHSYENVSAPILWKLVGEDLPILERTCREELGRTRTGNA
ncbi:MAG TPA: HepT-like ribonuclease domain-containing protein [Candidatus Binataceae bacterium]|nr:HepT-like ribonuclease domain-containing protein [Candidatus Binataceae bacterium]